MVSILDNQKLLSMADAAEILGVTPKAVYHFADADARSALGKRWLETCLVGRLRKTTREAIQRFLQQEEPTTPAPVAVSNDYQIGLQLLNSL